MTKLNKNIETLPTCVGSGFITLDVILNGNPLTPAKLCVGGSCGNVLTILSFLGWNSNPIARLSNNEATRNLLKDFSKFNVNTKLISKENDGSTPIIIHRILKDKNGNPKHKFEFKIPGSIKWLPSYKPVLSSKVESLVNKQNESHVFYFDRISRSSIDLAKYYKSKGALIVFEPSSLKETKLFQECLSLADILKYSNERINNYSELFPSAIVPMEIETLGNNGLKYRLKADKSKKWNNIKPFNISHAIDTAGAGDWCTAGIINELGKQGFKSFKNSDKKAIEKALTIGQALGAINCIYDGARGIMYNIDYSTLTLIVKKLINENTISIPSKNSKIKIISESNLDFNLLL